MKKKSQKKSEKPKMIVADPLSIRSSDKAFPKNDSAWDYRTSSGLMEPLINISCQGLFSAGEFPPRHLGISQVLPESFANILKSDAIESNVAHVISGEDMETLLQSLVAMRQLIQEIARLVREIVELS